MVNSVSRFILYIFLPLYLHFSVAHVRVNKIMNFITLEKIKQDLDPACLVLSLLSLLTVRDIWQNAKKYRPVIKRVFSHYFETLFLILGTCIYTCNVTQLYLESWTANEQLEAVHIAGVGKCRLFLHVGESQSIGKEPCALEDTDQWTPLLSQGWWRIMMRNIGISVYQDLITFTTCSKLLSDDLVGQLII